MKNLEEFISDTPLDKVLILDKEGNRHIVEAYKIIIELGGKEYFIENVPHPKKPVGLTISFLSLEHQVERSYFAIYPGASNLIHLSIDSSPL
ncbi:MULTISPECIES: hypothetical protein [Chryseobacterium]|jgi:hypothetical protein|uniref:Uncharacterized protein n=1 Tax=Chryseobacterium geocarposphaerae TaxID=1416776 RepID=A0ABU1LBG8_9FLAO|nr:MULTISPECIES: hypothetical protein [Chryseobacterium]MDR6404062.1 hypothetical protein [Chryseobacterium geocarposphaerae]MDR6698419.1 hypothetical protein [Chryseobacterium ginsenosidimutans]